VLLSFLAAHLEQVVAHRYDEERRSQDHANPEAPAHIDEFGIGFFFNRIVSWSDFLLISKDTVTEEERWKIQDGKRCELNYLSHSMTFLGIGCQIKRQVSWLGEWRAAQNRETKRGYSRGDLTGVVTYDNIARRDIGRISDTTNTDNE